MANSSLYSGISGPQGTQGIIWKGAWITATAHTVDDAIEHNGASYICILNHTSDGTNEPLIGASWETYWDVLAEKGDPGIAGEVNTASTVGTAGVGLFKQKSGTDLEFKKLNSASSKVEIIDDVGNDEVTFDVVDATTSQKGAVELATDGENAAGVVVQGNDSRLSDARTPTAHNHVVADITDLDLPTAVQDNETLTTLSLNANVLKYTDEDGVATDLDLSLYLDDTNLARLTSGVLNPSTGIATFTRDDASTFTLDLSSLIDVDITTTLTESPTGVFEYTSEDATTTTIDISNFETSAELDSRDTSNKDRANHTGTQLSSTISDFDTTVTSSTHAGRSDNPHSVTKTQVGLSNVQNTKVKLNATVAPVVSDDTSAGYAVGSLWVDVVTDKAYICVDSTNGAAIWLDAASQDAFDLATDHIGDTNNPHSVTKTQVGLSNVQNTKVKLDATTDPLLTNDSSEGYSTGSVWLNISQNTAFVCVNANPTAAIWVELTSQGELDHTNLNNIGSYDHSQIDTHIDDTNNPHSVTKTQVGLSNVDNVQQIPLSEKGSANGVATLDGSGLVPASQLPSYVDDVLEYANLASFPGTGEAGKIYIDLDTGNIYRWSGTVYVEISQDALSQLNDHITDVNNPHSVTKTQVGLGNVENLKVKLDATVAPIVSDDALAGYAVGSLWVDVTNDKAYICVDSTNGAAIWLDTTSIGELDHTNLNNIGSYDHSQLDSHVDSVNNPHSVTASQVGNTTAQWNADKILDVVIDDTNKADNKALVYKSGTNKLEYSEIAVGDSFLDGGAADSNYGAIDDIDGGGA